MCKDSRSESVWIFEIVFEWASQIETILQLETYKRLQLAISAFHKCAPIPWKLLTKLCLLYTKKKIDDAKHVLLVLIR